MNRIDNDRIQRSVHENMMFDDVDGDGTGMGAIPDEREDDVVVTHESYGEEE